MGTLPQAQQRAAQTESARARAAVYHALAHALADPLPGVKNLLLTAVTAGAETLGSAACQRAALVLAALPSPNIKALRNSYACLIGDPGRQPVALYESLHRQGGLTGQVTWEIERHYRMLGLAPDDGELPDHASVELAFLGHLVTAEMEASAAGHGQMIERIKAGQRQFLRAHAGTWLPEVGEALAAAGDPFYAAVGRLLRGFLCEELSEREQDSKSVARHPTLKDPAACTLCGLCVGSCQQGALRVMESVAQTALTLNPTRCTGCNRCVRVCPEKALFLSLGVANPTNCRVMRKSPRAACPDCGRPTVSQAELDAVFGRLQPDPVVGQRMRLCIECKSLSA